MDCFSWMKFLSFICICQLRGSQPEGEELFEEKLKSVCWHLWNAKYAFLNCAYIRRKKAINSIFSWMFDVIYFVKMFSNQILK